VGRSSEEARKVPTVQGSPESSRRWEQSALLHPEIAEIDLNLMIIAGSEPVAGDGLHRQNHRALDDARMTAMIWLKLQEQ
jgi:hypothetical protein